LNLETNDCYSAERVEDLAFFAAAASSTQRPRAKWLRDAEVTSVNMHRLGESFVEEVSDVWRRVTVDDKAAAPGESLEFLALIQGWQSEVRGKRREQLLRLNDIGLRVALERINPGETIVLVHFGPCALFLHFGDHRNFFWLSRDHVVN
jgi:hypothetical protein